MPRKNPANPTKQLGEHDPTLVDKANISLANFSNGRLKDLRRLEVADY